MMEMMHFIIVVIYGSIKLHVIHPCIYSFNPSINLSIPCIHHITSSPILFSKDLSFPNKNATCALDPNRTALMKSSMEYDCCYNNDDNDDRLLV